MADNFGLKIGVEGEKAFKQALSDINQTVFVCHPAPLHGIQVSAAHSIQGDSASV